MYRLIFNIVMIIVGSAGIIKMSEDPLRTANILILLPIFWNAVRDYIRQHKDKRT